MEQGTDLAGLGATVLVAASGTAEWERVRDRFARWFRDQRAPSGAGQLLGLGRDVHEPPDLLHAVWASRLRRALAQAADKNTAAQQLRELLQSLARTADPQSPPADTAVHTTPGPPTAPFRDRTQPHVPDPGPDGAPDPAEELARVAVGALVAEVFRDLERVPGPDPAGEAASHAAPDPVPGPTAHGAAASPTAPDPDEEETPSPASIPLPPLTTGPDTSPRLSFGPDPDPEPAYARPSLDPASAPSPLSPSPDPVPAPAPDPAQHAPADPVPGPPRPSGSPLTADHVDFRRAEIHGPVVGVQIQHSYGARPPLGLGGPEDWPMATGLEPLAHGVRPARRVAGHPPLPPYVPRDADDTLADALAAAAAEGGLVLVLGEPFAGKTRTALAVLAAVLPAARVYAPDAGADLRGLPEVLRAAAGPHVLWLDDLDGHLGDGGLEPRLLARLAGARTVVLATLREDAYDEYRQGPRGRVLDLARIVELPREWTPAERSRAAEAADPRTARAAYLAGVEGIAAHLAVEPRLWADFQRARRRHPRGYALVRAAIDLARCGLRGPLPQDLILEVHGTHEVPAGMDREPPADAWAWAEGKRFGLLPLLRRRGPRAWEPVPCLVDMAEQEGGLPPVSGALRQRAVEVARENEAYDFQTVAELARTAFRDAAEVGDRAAMYRMGLLEESLGCVREAEDWLRQAAGAGVAKAAGRLGRLLARRGEDREAEPFLERAAEAGDGGAATLLGKLLRDRAVRWLETGAEQKDPEAVHLLADLLFTRGDSELLWDLYHTASAAGRTEVARSIGMYLLVWNHRIAGHAWLRRAADAGDEEAADMLEHAEPDPLEEVLTYFAPSDSYPLDRAHYGAVLEEAGRTGEASDHYREGYERGDSYAAYRLAVLLETQGAPDEARTWYRKAADLGHPAALKALGEAPATPDTVEE
ncbi:hypothetical protein [Streptomyces achromogenes]|uniref:hypothetical protein n=1 Tax=Streptomyces achromogenes TaxID=67255 RepID=UPI0036AA5277